MHRRGAHQHNTSTSDGVGELLQSGGQITLADAQGNTRMVIDAAGNATALSYDAYGMEIGGAAATGVNHRYTGEYFDRESGLYHLRARDYDPEIGRFISMDEHPGKQQIPLTLNKYLYANSDPVNHIDPSGNFAGSVGGLGGVSISSVSSIAAQAFLRSVQFGSGRAVAVGIYKQIRLASAALSARLIGPATQLMRRCRNNLMNCIPDFNTFIIGDSTSEHRDVVTAAMANRNAPHMLTYYKAGHKRDWLVSKRHCKGSRSAKTDCDEYPYASSYEGGVMNINFAETRLISASDNRSAGSILGQMYNKCEMKDKEPFLVLPLSNVGVPIPTSYFCKNGKHIKAGI